LRVAPVLLLLSGTLCACGIAVGAQIRFPAVPSNEEQSGPDPQAQDRIVGAFGGFAGSEANVRSLVAGLRQGNEVMLSAPARPGQPGMTARFTPPTRPMSYGDVRISLGLAREQLAQLGIAEPTPSQLKAVFAGGAIVSRATSGAPIPFLLPGVLPMRADGMGWNKIATNMGVKLGQAMGGKDSHAASIPSSPLLSNSVAARPAASGAGAPIARTNAPARRRPESVSPLVPMAAATASGAAAVARTTAVAKETAAPRSAPITRESAPKTPNFARETAPARDSAQSAPEPGIRRSERAVMTVADSATKGAGSTTPAQVEGNGTARLAGAPADTAPANDELDRREDAQALE
jgi:hypothetical protein